MTATTAPAAYYRVTPDATVLSHHDSRQQAWRSMTRTVAHYERYEQIGEGTYGQVYRAKCTATGRIVALKKTRIMSSKGYMYGMPLQLIREIKILKQLQHPNLLELIEVVTSKGVEHLDPDDPPTTGEFSARAKLLQQQQQQKDSTKQREGKSKSEDGMEAMVGNGTTNTDDAATLARERYKGNLFLVLEYVSHDLTGLLDIAYQFTEVQIKCIFQQLLRALAHLHRHKVVHRDIKSSNILIDSHYRLKLADFGLARSLEPPLLEQMEAGSSSSGGGEGGRGGGGGGYTMQDISYKVITLWYRPPEILLGAVHYDYKVDMWSAGCILAELICNKPLMPGKSEMEQLSLIADLAGTPDADTWSYLTSLKKSSRVLDDVNVVKVTARAGELQALPERQPNMLRDKLRKRPTASDSACTLLEKLLEWDPRKRITADSALDSRFFWTAPVPPSNPADLGPIDVAEDGHFHEFQTKQKRREAKAIAEGTKDEALRNGLTKSEADAAYDETYQGLMNRVAAEGLRPLELDPAKTVAAVAVATTTTTMTTVTGEIEPPPREERSSSRHRRVDDGGGGGEEESDSHRHRESKKLRRERDDYEQYDDAVGGGGDYDDGRRRSSSHHRRSTGGDDRERKEDRDREDRERKERKSSSRRDPNLVDQLPLEPAFSPVANVENDSERRRRRDRDRDRDRDRERSRDHKKGKKKSRRGDRGDRHSSRGGERKRRNRDGDGYHYSPPGPGGDHAVPRDMRERSPGGGFGRDDPPHHRRRRDSGGPPVDDHYGPACSNLPEPGHRDAPSDRRPVPPPADSHYGPASSSTGHDRDRRRDSPPRGGPPRDGPYRPPSPLHGPPRDVPHRPPSPLHGPPREGSHRPPSPLHGPAGAGLNFDRRAAPHLHGPGSRDVPPDRRGGGGGPEYDRPPFDGPGRRGPDYHDDGPRRHYEDCPDRYRDPRMMDGPRFDRYNDDRRDRDREPPHYPDHNRNHRGGDGPYRRDYDGPPRDYDRSGPPHPDFAGPPRGRDDDFRRGDGDRRGSGGDHRDRSHRRDPSPPGNYRDRDRDRRSQRY